MLFCAAPHHIITIVCSSRILTSAELLSVVLYYDQNQYYVNLSYLKATSKTVGHCNTEIEHKNLCNEHNFLYPRSEQNFQKQIVVNAAYRCNMNFTI